jgi:hypothetical protein
MKLVDTGVAVRHNDAPSSVVATQKSNTPVSAAQAVCNGAHIIHAWMTGEAAPPAVIAQDVAVNKNTKAIILIVKYLCVLLSIILLSS